MDIEKIVALQNRAESFFKEYERTLPVVLFGAGGGCLPAIKSFKKYGITPLAIADNDKEKWGQEVEGIEISSIDTLEKRCCDFVVFVSAPNNAHYIIPNLRKKIPHRKIYFCDYPHRIDRKEYKKYITENSIGLQNIYSSLQDSLSQKTMENMLKGWGSGDFSYFEDIYVQNQYFDKNIMKLKKNEVFLDVGAFDGDTVKGFLTNSDGKYKKIIAIEPNPECQMKLWSLQKEVPCMQVISKGAYSRKGRFRFISDEIGSISQFSLVEDCNGIMVDTVDSLVNEPITLLKMDIEGLEQAALKGATATILRYRPKLAICVYHKMEDLLAIAEFILGLNLGYSLYLRHHSFYTGETVLYAV